MKARSATSTDALVAKALSKLSLTEVAEMQGHQLSYLGPYWTERLSPFLGTDGKELPMRKLTPDQLEICRTLVQKIDSRYYVQAAVMLIREDGQLIVAMRLEVERGLLSEDRGLVTASSSDNGSSWNYVKATNERGDPTRVLYPAVLHDDSLHLLGEPGDPMEIDDCDLDFLLEGDSVADVSMVDAFD
jgi:hypothetical protein